MVFPTTSDLFLETRQHPLLKKKKQIGTISITLPQKNQKSLEAVKNVCDIPTNQLPIIFWINRRGLANAASRLNENWQGFMHSKLVTARISVHVATLPGIRSYHVPIMFEVSFTPYKFMYHLKFLNMWALFEHCHDFIKNIWDTQIVGFSIFILDRKLQILKTNPRAWNKIVFGDIYIMVKTSNDNFQNIQNQISTYGITGDLII